MRAILFLIEIGLLCFVLASCSETDVSPLKENPLIAKVEQHELRQSDLDLLFSDGISASDSAAVANAFIEKWIRNQLWTIEAENHVKENPEINQMVDSYKSSLLKMAYETQVLEEKLDSTIMDQEYEDTYESYKNQFVLDDRLLKGWFARIPKAVDGQTGFFNAWKMGNKSDVQEFCDATGGSCLLRDSTWVDAREYRSYVPLKFISFSQIKQLSNFRKSDPNYNYYLKYTAFVDKNELAPLNYIKEELKRVILHGRKQKIIADLTEEMYEEKIQSNRIQVFTNK